MVAVPSRGRASQVTPRRAAPEADATRELYERFARQIYSYCLHQLGTREEAEDATQSTFLNAFRGLKRGVDPEFESAWLYKIAQNVCLTRQRSSSRRRRIETPGDLEAMQDYVPAHQADSDELIHLPEALESMPEQQRRALLLREWQGLSYKEIAVELDVSQAAVETLLFRARRTLANELVEAPPKKASAAARRLRRSRDAGSLLAILKSMIFAGGTKVAATVATVAATSVVAASPATRHAVEEVVAPAHDLRTPVHHVARPAAKKKPVVTHAAAPAAVVAVSEPSISRRHPAAAVSRPRPIAPRRTSRTTHGPRRVRSAHVRPVTVAHAVVPTVAAPAPAPADQPDPAPTAAPPTPAPAEPTPAAAPPAPAPSPPVANTPKNEDGGTGHDDGHRGSKGHHGKNAAAPVPAPVEPAPAAAPTPAPAPVAMTSQPAPASDDGDDRHGGNHGDKGAHHEHAAAGRPAADTTVEPAPTPPPVAAPPAPAETTSATPPAPDVSSDASDDGDHGQGHHGGGREK